MASAGSGGPGGPVAAPALVAAARHTTADIRPLTAAQQSAFDALLGRGGEALVDPSVGVPMRIDLRRSARRQATDASTEASANAAQAVSATETELPVFPAATVVAGQSWRRAEPGGGSSLGLTLQAQATLAQVRSFYRAQMPEGAHDQLLNQMLSSSADGFDLRQANLRQRSLKRVEVAAVPPAVFIHLTLTRSH